jgi:hypothetical protein
MEVNMKSLRRGTALAVCLSVGIAAAANGFDPGDPARIDSVRDLSRLRAPFTPDAAGSAQLAQLRTTIALAPAESLMASADLGAARPVPVAAEDAVWLAPTVDDGLCVFVPQPGDGRYAASCSTLDQLNATGSVSATLGSSGDALVVVVEPDGVADPVVVRQDGVTVRLPLRQNVAIAYAGAGDRVRVSSFELVIPGR